MSDELVKGLLCNAAINFYAISAPNTVEQARRLHDASPVCTAALGRSLMAASMLGCMLKVPDGEVSFMVKGGGPAGNIVCVGRPDASVKGYITNPQVDLPPRESDGKLDVGGAVGKDGTLVVITDLGLKEPYVGQSDLVSGEIAEDLASYFVNSQQQPSAVFLGVHLGASGVTSAAGMILQPLPFCLDDAVEKLERRLYTLAEMPGLMEAGMTLEEFVRWAFGDMDPVFTETLTPAFRCDCSKKRLREVLFALGEKELLDMAEAQHGAQLVCHFCGGKYEFSEAELREIAARAAEAKARREDLDEPAD